MQTLAIYQLKGGVGKTSSAVNLAAMAAADGLTTLLWDLDPQAAASWYLSTYDETAEVSAKHWLSGQSPIGRLVERTLYDRLDLLPGSKSNRLLDVLLRKVEPPRKALSRLIKPFSEHYQLIIIDAPPSLGHLAENIMTAADLILMPVVPGYLSWRTAEQVVDHARSLDIPTKRFEAFYTMADRRRGLHRAQIEAPPPMPIRLNSIVVPYAASVERMGEHRAPLAAFAASDDPALLAYAALWADLRARL